MHQQQSGSLHDGQESRMRLCRQLHHFVVRFWLGIGTFLVISLGLTSGNMINSFIREKWPQ
jgi:ABC-type protease/lipase transport system fused ATPase/permease subunit